MIYFITNRTDHHYIVYKSAKITVKTQPDELIDKFFTTPVIGYDSEGTGNRLYKSEVLLLQYGTKDTQLIFDCTKGQYKQWIPYINSQLKPDHLLLGHNLKYDLNLAYPYGLYFPNILDTLVTEQRLNLGAGIPNNLKDTIHRRLNKFMEQDKETRKDFIYMTNENALFNIKHILYGAGDVEDLYDLAVVQREIAKARGQYEWIKAVEYPLVKVLSEMELVGVPHNPVKWISLLKNKRQEKFNCEKFMDQEIVKLGKGNNKLLGGKYNTNRKKGVLEQTNMFGGPSLQIENKNIHNINYNSGPSIIDTIERLGLPTPKFETRKEGQIVESDSIKEEAIQAYKMEYPSSPLTAFFNKLLEYKGLQKFISSYGEKFLYEIVQKPGNKSEYGYRNSITNRVHTIFKQCFTETGRLSSGDSKKRKDVNLTVYFNCQNLPAEKEIREGFELTKEEIAAGYYITTIDLSGAELIIMAALANDMHLYELGKVKDDIHSPVCTKSWRAVYQHRKSKLISYKRGTLALVDSTVYTDEQIYQLYTKEELDKAYTIQDSKSKIYILTEDFLVDKENNKQLRTDFKPMIFGCVYGLKAKKGSETLNIPKDDAQVIIDVIRGEFPLTFKMVEDAAKQALLNGYVTFNGTSNNRRWFLPVVELLERVNRSKYSQGAILNYVRTNLPFDVLSDIEGEARNCRIQGTQADMIKDIMVTVNRYFKENNLDAYLILSVHDEIVFVHKDPLAKPHSNPKKAEKGEFESPLAIKVKEIMAATATKYLKPYSSTITMGAEATTKYAWTK